MRECPRAFSWERQRFLPIPAALAVVLEEHFAASRPAANDLLFPGEAQRYAAVRRAWDRVCLAAGINGVTPHVARHTYGVHAAQSNVPIVRLQKLLGHATPQMTMRYMQHAPEAYLDGDAERISASMSDARAISAKSTLKLA